MHAYCFCAVWQTRKEINDACPFQHLKLRHHQPQKALPNRPAIPIYLGANSFDSYGTIPFYFTESVAKSCAEGLQQRGIIHVELTSRDMTRADAVKQAKKMKEGYVVLLELRSDRMRSSGQENDLSRVYIEYAVFAAATAKHVTSGPAYQQSSGIRDIIVGRSDSLLLLNSV